MRTEEGGQCVTLVSKRRIFGGYNLSPRTSYTLSPTFIPDIRCPRFPVYLVPVDGYVVRRGLLTLVLKTVGGKRKVDSSFDS